MRSSILDEHAQENLPLQNLLKEQSWTAYQRANILSRNDFTTASDDDLVHRVTNEWRRFARPLARHSEPEFPRDEPPSVWRRGQNGAASYWRWVTRFPFAGNAELLGGWPSAYDGDPISSDLDNEPAPDFVLSLNDHWITVLCDVPATEDEVGSSLPLNRLTLAARFLDYLILLINEELVAFEAAMLDELREIITARRERLHVIHKKTVDAIELLVKESPPLVVEEAALSNPQSSSPGLRKKVSVEMQVALTRQTFSDLVRVILQWAKSVQQYPQAYAKMDEEDITSTLVTSLNLVFDTAQREVFVGSGKSDIYVEMDLGNRQRSAFVGEAKMWSGRSGVVDHVRQLLRYAPEHLRETLLLYYVTKIGIDKIKKDATASISSWEGFVRWEKPGEVAIVMHPADDHEVSIAVVYVHLPQPK